MNHHCILWPHYKIFRTPYDKISEVFYRKNDVNYRLIAFDFILDWLNSNHFRSKTFCEKSNNFRIQKFEIFKFLNFLWQKWHFLYHIKFFDEGFEFLIQQRIWRRAASPFLVKCSSSFLFDKQLDKQLDIQWFLLQVSILRHGRTCLRFVSREPSGGLTIKKIF